MLKSEGWTNKAIAQALRIHEETVRQHLTDWSKDEKLKPENGGSYSKLNDMQSRALDTHIAETTAAFFEQIKTAYPNAPKIHIIFDQFGYHPSQLVRDKAWSKTWSFTTYHHTARILIQ